VLPVEGAYGRPLSGTNGRNPPVNSDIADLQRRVSAVEEEQTVVREQAQRAVETFTTLSREFAELRAALGQQRTLLNTISRVQTDQNATLRRQSDAIGGLVLEMTAIRQTQADQSLILAEHGQLPAEHGQTLKEHGHTLKEHGQLLRQVLDRLTVNEN
jgi:hypothetical protein